MFNYVYMTINYFQYILQFLIGGTLMTLLYHYSNKKNIVACAIIPTLPVLFLVGLIYIPKKNAIVSKYIKNSAIYFSFYFIFVLTCLLLYVWSNKLLFSIGVSSIIYLISLLLYIYSNKI